MASRLWIRWKWHGSMEKRPTLNRLKLLDGQIHFEGAAKRRHIARTKPTAARSGFHSTRIVLVISGRIQSGRVAARTIGQRDSHGRHWRRSRFRRRPGRRYRRRPQRLQVIRLHLPLHSPSNSTDNMWKCQPFLKSTQFISCKTFAACRPLNT